MNMKQAEEAAREYCRLRGWNPDEEVYERDVIHAVPRWTQYTEQIQELMFMMEALENVKNQELLKELLPEEMGAP